MHEDLVLLFEPRVHLVPVEGHVILEIASLGLKVSPGRLLRDAFADLDREEARITFPRMVARVGGRNEEVGANIGHREVINS